jgi:hypothetical protein
MREMVNPLPIEILLIIKSFDDRSQDEWKIWSLLSRELNNLMHTCKIVGQVEWTMTLFRREFFYDPEKSKSQNGQFYFLIHQGNIHLHHYEPPSYMKHVRKINLYIRDHFSEKVLYRFLKKFPNIEILHVHGTAKESRILDEMKITKRNLALKFPNEINLSKLISMEFLREISFQEINYSQKNSDWLDDNFLALDVKKYPALEKITYHFNDTVLNHLYREETRILPGIKNHTSSQKIRYLFHSDVNNYNSSYVIVNASSQSIEIEWLGGNPDKQYSIVILRLDTEPFKVENCTLKDVNILCFVDQISFETLTMDGCYFEQNHFINKKITQAKNLFLRNMSLSELTFERPDFTFQAHSLVKFFESLTTQDSIDLIIIDKYNKELEEILIEKHISVIFEDFTH